MDKNRRYSFFQLFTKGDSVKSGNYRLVIPIIQRDYAQGRDNENAKEIRTEFLSQLHAYMTTASGSHDLDFVYGSSAPDKDTSKKREFIPLDGQQRLTTLFLIHIYLAMRTKDGEESIRFYKTIRTTNGNLIESLFSYRTRSSAVEFCNCLVDDGNDFSEVFGKDEAGNRIYKKTLSDYICNTSWFYPDWLHDPTVKGMLTVLDAIDHEFDASDHYALLRRLMSDTDPSITFIFMDLDDYKLTDDLYIKMNSRGKPLTSFENFKAKYEQYIGQLEKGDVVGNDEIDYDTDGYHYDSRPDDTTIRTNKSIYDLRCAIQKQGNTITQSVKDYFAFNIDTKWLKPFWEFSKSEIDKKEKEIAESKEQGDKVISIDKLLSETLDLKVSRFIKMVLTNQYAIDHRSGKTTIPKDLTGDKELSFGNLKNQDAISENGVVLLTKIFELYSGSPMEVMPEWTHRYFDEKGVFDSIIKGEEFTYPKRLMHYAYTAFRLKFGDSRPYCLVEWMRFLYNLTLDENSIQDITGVTYHRAVSSVNRLLGKLDCDNPSIISLLSSANAPKEIEFFPEHQYREEVLKSHLMIQGGICLLHKSEALDLPVNIVNCMTWETLILKLESHEYFNGQIGFIFKMAGIDDYYAEYNNLRWGVDADMKFRNAVVKYGRIASTIFAGGYSKRVLAKNAMFERAMLAKAPQYLQTNFFNSTNQSYGSTNVLRDYSWKSVLRLNSANEGTIHMVKDLFDIINIDDIESSLNNIIDHPIDGPQWRADIIRYDYLIPMCTNGFFNTTADGHKILINRRYFSQDDTEIYTGIIYWEYLKTLLNNLSIEGLQHKYQYCNSYDEIPHVKITINNITVKIKSYVNASDGNLACHYIWIDSNGNKDLETFLSHKGFQKKNENDSTFRRKEQTFDHDMNIDEYRKVISRNIIDLISDLSSFGNAKSYGQQQS